MRLNKTTPVPNIFFDSLMSDLSSSAVRVYLKIIRNTFGWRDENGNPKKRDWISHSQFSKVGLSNRSVTNALDELIEKNLITLTDYSGNDLTTPKQRKQAQRIFYSITNNTENNTLTNAKNDKTKAQNLRPTKEISLPKYNVENEQKEMLTDRQRIDKIIEQQKRKQMQRDSWL